MRVLAATATTALLLAGPLHAATIWVSPAGTGSGASEAVPTSVAQAQTLAQPGDTVTFVAGAYPTMTWAKAGAPTAPITLKAKTQAVAITAGVAQFSPAGSMTRFESGFRVQADDLVVDGFYTGRRAAVGIDVRGGRQNVVIRNVWTYEPTSSGIVVFSAAAGAHPSNIHIQGSYFENNDTVAEPNCATACGRGAVRTDYGIRLYRVTAGLISESIFDGYFHHAISVKDANPSITIRNNHFDYCGAWCLELGQERDFDDSRDIDRTSGLVEVRDNLFTSGPGKSGERKLIAVINQATTIIAGNTIRERGNIVVASSVAQAPDTVLAQWPPVLPRHVLLDGNELASGTLIRLRGRGVPTTAEVRNNRGPSVTCEIQPFQAQGPTNYASHPDLGPPTVIQSGNSFSCR